MTKRQTTIRTRIYRLRAAEADAVWSRAEAHHLRRVLREIADFIDAKCAVIIDDRISRLLAENERLRKVNDDLMDRYAKILDQPGATDA